MANDLINLNVLRNINVLRLKSIRFQNFKVFEDFTFDFTNENGIKEFICFIGPNGCGKSTILNSIQMIFNRYEGRDIERVKTNLGKAVRHVSSKMNGVYGDDDFLITANISSYLGDYEIQFNKSGFIKDHPEEIKNNVYRLCYFARFDQELNTFQLAREKWPKFKELYEAVTGFTIEENQDIEKYLYGINDPTMKNLIENYVLSFNVHKPNEVINQKECSDGEKKIIKSFSTLLTVEYIPQIILVDNIEMHVEKGRHIKLIEAMKDCFPYSQIFSTTHSHAVSKIYNEKNGVFDLRVIKCSEQIQKEPWRLCIIDEINDAIVKVQAAKDSSVITAYSEEHLIAYGEKLKEQCKGNIKDIKLFKYNIDFFLKEVLEIYVKTIFPRI